MSSAQFCIWSFFSNLSLVGLQGRLAAANKLAQEILHTRRGFLSPFIISHHIGLLLQRLPGNPSLQATILEKLVMMFFTRLPLATNLPRLLRELEHDVEAVINVLQPGPLGIIEHRFSAEEVRKAKTTVEQAVNNWKMNASLRNNSHSKKHEANQATGSINQT